MFDKSDKRRLYWLINEYLLGKIDARTFCDEYYYCYSLELSRDTLTEIEERAFAELNTISSRFSEFEEDLINYAGTYFTEAQLKQKAIETNEKLDAGNG